MKIITANELVLWLQEGHAIRLIDVREVEEVREGHIPNSLNIPLGEMEARLQELDKKEQYIMICRSGNRSGKATQLLQNNGFDAMNLLDGILGWTGETSNTSFF